MKKVLFATSALVMSAGFAVAEVAVSGDARMGMIYDGDDVQFSSRARVLFTLTGESDAGLSFGASFRADQENYGGAAVASGKNQRSASNGGRGVVWVSGTYGKLSMGDPVGAAEAAIGDLYAVGYTDGTFGGDPEEISFLVGDGANRDQGPTILYEYSIDNISFFASATDGVDRGLPGDLDAATGAVDNASVAYSLAVKYDAGNWNAALSYSDHDDLSEIGLGAEATFDAFSVKGVYMHYDNDAATSYLKRTIGLAGAYNVDAWTVKGFWRQDKFDNVIGEDKFDSFGIGADYDLGGGATLAGGIIDSDYNDDTVADLGVKFKF